LVLAEHRRLQPSEGLSQGYAQVWAEVRSGRTGDSASSFSGATASKSANPPRTAVPRLARQSAGLGHARTSRQAPGGSAPGRFAPGDATVSPINGGEEKREELSIDRVHQNRATSKLCRSPRRSGPFKSAGLACLPTRTSGLTRSGLPVFRVLGARADISTSQLAAAGSSPSGQIPF